MRKPNFFIVGAPKCGTTALASYLSKHPDIFMSPVKECAFFGTDCNPKITKLSDYLALFSQATNQKRVGEASVCYLYSKTAAENIKQFDPAAKIIIMLRDPVDMIYAYHSELYFIANESIADFEEALKAEPDRKMGKRLPPFTDMPKFFFCYREMGKYKKFVELYLSVFSAENVHVIDFDQFKRETDKVFRSTCQFLDVDPDVPMTFPIVNENKTFRSKRLIDFVRYPPLLIRKAVRATLPCRVRQFIGQKIFEWNFVRSPRPPLRPELRAELNAEFAQDVEELGRMLGRDFRHWAK
jgi:hypothetical protein